MVVRSLAILLLLGATLSPSASAMPLFCNGIIDVNCGPGAGCGKDDLIECIKGLPRDIGTSIKECTAPQWIECATGTVENTLAYVGRWLE